MRYEKQLTIDEGLKRWAEASAVAGALMPAAVRHEVETLEWPARDINAFDISEAVCDAARRVHEAWDAERCPIAPRGCHVGIDPDGSCSLVWESETHTITLLFLPGKYQGGIDGGIDHETCILRCDYEREDSPRLAICQGRQAEVNQ